MTDTPHEHVPYVPGPTAGPEPTSWMPGAAPAQRSTIPAPADTSQPRPTEAIPSPPPHRAGNGRPILIGALAGLVVVVLAAAGVGGVLFLRSAGSFTLQGSLVLTSGYDNNMACAGKGNLSDIAAGAPITVTDESGTMIALGRLPTGEARNEGCVFEFRVPGVPDGKGFYGVEVSHRGVVRYSAAEVKSGKLALSLG